MLPRLFDGDPERYSWLYASSAPAHAHGLARLARAYGRTPLTRVGLIGALPETALALAHDGAEVHACDPDVQRVAMLSVRAMQSETTTVQVTTSSLPAGLSAVLAPAGVLSSLESDDAVVALLTECAEALLPGGVLVVELWHPRLLLEPASLRGCSSLPAAGDLPPARARFALAGTNAPLPLLELSAHVEGERGQPYGSTKGSVRLLTLPEWRAVFARVPTLEEAAITAALDSSRPYLEGTGDTCVFVLVRARSPWREP